MSCVRRTGRAEFGIVLPLKVTCLRHGIGAHLEALPGYANRCIGDLLAHADQLDLRIADYDKAISQAAREDAASRRLMERPGIGPIINRRPFFRERANMQNLRAPTFRKGFQP